MAKNLSTNCTVRHVADLVGGDERGPASTLGEVVGHGEQREAVARAAAGQRIAREEPVADSTPSRRVALADAVDDRLAPPWAT